MRRNNFEITIVNQGIANRLPGNRIEINKKLLQRKYWKLLNEILSHEMAHTDIGYSEKDLMLDLMGFKQKRLYRNFILTTPSAWTQFFPIYYSRGRFYYDISVLFLWFFIFGVILFFISFVELLS